MRSWSSTTANRLVSLPGPTCWASSSTENGFSAGGSGRLWRSGWLPGPPGCERGQGEANEHADGVLDGIHRHEQQHAAVRAGGSHPEPVSYTHLRAHETRHDLVC